MSFAASAPRSFLLHNSAAAQTGDTNDPDHALRPNAIQFDALLHRRQLFDRCERQRFTLYIDAQSLPG